MGFCCNGLGWGMGGLGSLGVIGLILNGVFFIGLVVLAVIGIRWAVRQFASRSSASAPDALEIARRRLAAGEISTAEFEEIRERLLRSS